MGKLYVIGAGLAGLACAVEAARSGREVVLCEGSGLAGGRCRSFYDTTLEREIDNGSHLILGANTETFAYLETIGAENELTRIEPPAFPFLDLGTMERWTLRPGAGSFPFWLLSERERIPGTSFLDYLTIGRLAMARKGDTVGDHLRKGSLMYKRVWQPLTVSALNTGIEEASAKLMWRLLANTLLRGEPMSRPYIVKQTLGATFIEPALAFLKGADAHIHFNRPLKALEIDGLVGALVFSDGSVDLGPGDQVVLALPPWAIADLLPEITVPDSFRAIVNAHFLLTGPAAMPERSPILGLTSGIGEWLFVRDDVVSVTVSNADTLALQSADAIATTLWTEVTRALDLDMDGHLPPFRVIKEKRATIAHSPAQLDRRPAARTAYANLWLAGDWTGTGLPCTIEGAVFSGHKAAGLAMEAKG